VRKLREVVGKISYKLAVSARIGSDTYIVEGLDAFFRGNAVNKTQMRPDMLSTASMVIPVFCPSAESAWLIRRNAYNSWEPNVEHLRPGALSRSGVIQRTTKAGPSRYIVGPQGRGHLGVSFRTPRGGHA
jgi:hypothetical protein